MSPILFGWIFSVFIYVKVAFALTYREGANVLTALLIAIVFGLVIFVTTFFYARNLMRFTVFNLSRVPGWTAVIRRTLIPFLIALILYLAVARFIVIGFDRQFNQDMTGWGRSPIPFLFVVGAPLVLHYLMVIWPVARGTQSRQG
jgi:hypothetical protein